jgi:DNA-binding transcriptional regulator YhcF (GntR family)
MKVKQDIAKEQIDDFVKNMKKLGFSVQDILKLMEKNIENEGESDGNHK